MASQPSLKHCRVLRLNPSSTNGAALIRAPNRCERTFTAAAEPWLKALPLRAITVALKRPVRWVLGYAQRWGTRVLTVRWGTRVRTVRWGTRVLTGHAGRPGRLPAPSRARRRGARPEGLQSSWGRAHDRIAPIRPTARHNTAPHGTARHGTEHAYIPGARAHRFAQGVSATATL